LTGAVDFDETGYRRNSCCLYYRTPRGGLCGDCALDRAPERHRHD
jgi:iron complex transport system ATP-binding protein